MKKSTVAAVEMHFDKLKKEVQDKFKWAGFKAAKAEAVLQD